MVYAQLPYLGPKGHVLQRVKVRGIPFHSLEQL